MINKTTNMINPENIISLLFPTTLWYAITEIETTLTISDENSTNHDIFQYLISFIRYSHLFYHKTNPKYYCYKIFTQKNSIHVISNCNLSYQRFLLIKVCFYSWKTTTHTIHLTSQNKRLATQKRTTKMIYYVLFLTSFLFSCCKSNSCNNKQDYVSFGLFILTSRLS